MQQTDTMGTMCQNRKGVPDEIKKEKLKKKRRKCGGLQGQIDDHEVERQE
jgi:hypothetical protein